MSLDEFQRIGRAGKQKFAIGIEGTSIADTTNLKVSVLGILCPDKIASAGNTFPSVDFGHRSRTTPS